ncbi:glycosyltransferase family 2 protein [Aureimonas mangrovi]|uniref:glycosyltransferase family 2 protein n=1 Tax=Aureimonas mangrovi TaxID=2758041 RepID=UPI00163D6F54|nr:glycosyltransferase family 2 protein [Aureimonas mangrovi]
MSASVAVVVPFFQKERGILARSLASVFAQELPAETRMRVMVVDDASPVPLAHELANITVPEHIELTALKRENGGPGAARNTGLDALDPAQTEFVAFLDSDDTWASNHIADALHALRTADADFYFCDHTRFDIEGTWFGERRAFANWGGPGHPDFSALPGSDAAVSIAAADLFPAMLDEYLSQTSTVVYRYARHPALRFDVTLRNAGEDHLFWLELVKAGERSVISFAPNVHCGRGVNVYYDALDWASPKVTSRYGYLVMFRLKIMQSFALDAETRTAVSRQLDVHTRAYSYLFVRQLAKGTMPDLKLASKLFAMSPARMAAMPMHFARGLRTRKSEAHLW